MRRLLCLALAALPVCGGQRQATLAPIALYTDFEQNPPAPVLDSLQLELESIMAPMGLSFQWRNLATGSRQPSVELAVIHFKGRCDVAGLTSHDANPGPLGWTHISRGAILPFADVDCSAVRSFIQKELLAICPKDRDPAFGRALGRVLAHELYHIFADTKHHGSDGVAREYYSVQDLLSGDFQFQPSESQALIHSKAHAALSNAGGAEPDAAHRL